MNELKKILVSADRHSSKCVTCLKLRGRLSPSTVLTDLKDPYSCAVLDALVLNGALNVSQINRRIKECQGKSCRKTVRSRLKSLTSMGFIEVKQLESNVVYNAHDDLVRLWMKFIGD
jgi:hypothetical protein